MQIKHVKQAHRYEVQRGADYQCDNICKGKLQEYIRGINPILHGYWEPFKTEESKKGIKGTK